MVSIVDTIDYVIQREIKSSSVIKIHAPPPLWGFCGIQGTGETALDLAVPKIICS